MDILIIEPGQAPYEQSISGGLAAMQAVVGGPIEAVYPYDDPVALICHDRGGL